MAKQTRASGWSTQKISSDKRGYGKEHRQLRAKWRPIVEAGGVICWRCDLEIMQGQEWHLGHADDNRQEYKGPEHKGCNIKGASAKAHSVRWNKDPAPTPRTNWGIDN